MKNVKILLPLFAILIAISGAFASGWSNNKSLSPVPVVVNQNSCQIIGECTNEGLQPCQTEEDEDLFSPGSGTSCNVPAVGDFEE